MLKLKKPKTGIALFAVVAAMLITATFAARTLTQHKTSRAQTTFAQDNVVLVSKFDPTEALNWKIHEVITNEAFVRNGQDNDDKDKYIYEDAYVRLQIKEYLEFIDYEYIYSDVRLMVDKSGDFIKADTREDLKAWMEVNDIEDDSRIVGLKGYYDTETSYYIATKPGDTNGEYGKFLIMGRDDTTKKSVVIGQENQTPQAIEGHHDIINNEEIYTTHTWSDREYISYADTNNPISQYVKLGLGNDVITKEAWITDGAQPVKKWIIDTDSEEGWVYWGDILAHDNTITNAESITANFINSVELIGALEGQADYYNRINMDAVSFNDMDMWTDAPDEIYEAFGVNRDPQAGYVKKINNLMDEVKDIDYLTYFTLTQAMSEATTVIKNEEATLEELKDAYTNLKSAYREVLRNEEEFLRNSLAPLIQDAESKDLSIMLSASIVGFEDVLASSKAILVNENSTFAEVKVAAKALNVAINNLRLASDGPIPEGGKVLDFAGQDWVVLYEDGEGHALIALDRQLQEEDYAKIGILNDGYTEFPSILFHHTDREYLPGGYEMSKLKETDVAFYNTFIEDHVDNNAILPVEITQEVMIEDKDQSNARTDAPTVINITSGTKTAFSLSVSDMNVYNIQIPRKLMSVVYESGTAPGQWFNIGLRSPGHVLINRAYSNQYFNEDQVTTRTENNDCPLFLEFVPVIPCMWITIGS